MKEDIKRKIGIFFLRKINTNVKRFKDQIKLPKLNWELNELEPFISEKMNFVHYTKHHQAYIDGYYKNLELQKQARANGLAKEVYRLDNAIDFHAGGYINHCLFWENLASPKQGGGVPPSIESNFFKKLQSQYGKLETFIDIMIKKLSEIQGSGWGVLVKDKSLNNSLNIMTVKNQDTIGGLYVPLLMIDAWEHAYYIDHLNNKMKYYKDIWNVVNWKEVEKRFNI